MQCLMLNLNSKFYETVQDASKPKGEPTATALAKHIMFVKKALLLPGLLLVVGYDCFAHMVEHNPLEAFQKSQWLNHVDYSPYNISLDVSRSRLPAEGGWVEVTWSNVPYPGSDDLLALFVPAEANPRETSFAKYQWAIASPDHLPHGKGTLRWSKHLTRSSGMTHACAA